MSYFSEEVSFILNPRINQKPKKINAYRKLLVLLISFALVVSIDFAISHINVYWIDIGRFLKNSESNVSVYFSIFLICIYYPIIEELSFRIFLVFKPIFLRTGIVALLFHLLFSNNIMNWSVDIIGLLFKSAILILVGVILSLKINNRLLYQKLEGIWNRRFKIIYYSQILVFAFLHLVKFNLTKEIFIFLPIILLPYFISGLIFSYLRLRINTLASILVHIGLNSAIIIITVQLL